MCTSLPTRVARNWKSTLTGSNVSSASACVWITGRNRKTRPPGRSSYRPILERLPYFRGSEMGSSSAVGRNERTDGFHLAGRHIEPLHRKRHFIWPVDVKCFAVRRPLRYLIFRMGARHRTGRAAVQWKKNDLMLG